MRRDPRDGYALMEVMLGLMLIALLAALGLPGLARGTGPATLRVSALELSALLREDRTQALRTGQPVTTRLDAEGAQSGATAATVAMPVGAEIHAPSHIRFMPDGHTSGGDIVIASENARMVISVSADTGAIHVAVP